MKIAREIKKIVIAVLCLFFLCLLLGCKTKTVYVPVKETSVETVTIRDTIIEMRLEYIRDSVVTSDSLSLLSNRYAYSYAEMKEGQLHHSLSTWPDAILPVKVQYIDRLRVDSIPAPYPVEVIRKVEKDLNWWHQLRMRIGEIAFVFVILGVIYLSAKRRIFI